MHLLRVLGTNYSSAAFYSKLMGFHEFLDEHVKGTRKPVGKIANYAIFDHIPELRQDIKIPEYAELRPGVLREYVRVGFD